MTRVNVTHSETGDFQGWFDLDAALTFEEDTYFDGNNMISKATGSQWTHETLYYTKSGNWVLYRTSQWQGSVDKYEKISQPSAMVWMLAQKCDSDGDFDKLPQAIKQAFAAAQDDSEL